MGSEFTKLDKVRETKLVTAIQKAAALSKVSDKPQHQLLAEQLRLSGFDHRFAKVATGAYNKRKTIDHMTSNPEQTRGNSFAIVDASDVAQALGGVSKTASAVTTGLVFKYTAGAHMQKTASQETTRKPLMPMTYMHDMTVQGMQQRMAQCLNKVAAQAQNQLHEIRSLVDHRDAVLSKAAAALVEHEHGYQALDAAVAAAGTGIVDVLKPYVPEMPEFVKVAGYYAPDQDLHLQLISAYRQAVDTDIQLMDKQAALQLMNDVASSIDQVQSMFVEQILTGGLDKTAAGWSTLITAVPQTALAASIAEVQGAAAAANALAPAVQQLASPIKVDPKQYITPKFIVDQRQLAHTMALSDMLADKELAKQYGVYDIAKMFNKLMQVSPEFQRPSRRQLLRDYIRTGLAQRGQFSTADLAAARKAVQRGKDEAGMVSGMLSAVQQNLQPVESPDSKASVSDMAKTVADVMAGSDKSMSRTFLQELKKHLQKQEQEARKKKQQQDKKKKKQQDKKKGGKSPNNKGNGNTNLGGTAPRKGGGKGQLGQGGKGQLGQGGGAQGHGQRNPQHQTTNP